MKESAPSAAGRATLAALITVPLGLPAVLLSQTLWPAIRLTTLM